MFSTFFIRRPNFAIVVSVVIVLAGVIALSVIPVAQFPNVPTVAETVPGYEAAVSFGLFAPKGTPREILIKINTDVQKVINDPEFRKRFLESLVVQPIPGSLDAFAEYLRKDSAKWAKVINAANLKID